MTKLTFIITITLILIQTISLFGEETLNDLGHQNESDSLAQIEQVVSEDTTTETLSESNETTPIDSQEQIEQVNLSNDTTPKSDSLLSVDSTIKESAIDTSIKQWRKKSFNIGIGWEIGKEPLFIKWNGYNDDILKTFKSIFEYDSLKVKTKVVEDPPKYSVLFPFRLSFSLPKKNGVRLTPILTYSAMKRDYISRISEIIQDTIDGQPRDTLIEIWKCKRKQSLREVSLGLRVSKFISDKYFIINGVDDVAINIGASVSPLLALSSKTSLKGTGISDTSYNFKAFGVGANWEVGLSTFKKTPAGNGVEIGLSYHGGWRGEFIKNGYLKGTSTENNDIGGSFVGGTENINFINHKLLIYVDLVLSKRAKESFNKSDSDDSESDTDASKEQ